MDIDKLLDENSPGKELNTDDSNDEAKEFYSNPKHHKNPWNAPWQHFDKKMKKVQKDGNLPDEERPNANDSDPNLWSDSSDAESEEEPDKTDFRNRYLWCAAKGNFTEFKYCVSKLDKGIDSTLVLKDKDGYTCLHKASSEGHLKIVEWILKKLKPEDLPKMLNNKTMNAWRPLHCAGYWSNTEVVRVLARHPETDVNATSDGGLSPLQVLCNQRKGRDAMIELMMFHVGEDCTDQEDRQYLNSRKSVGDNLLDLSLRSNADNSCYDFCRQKGPYVELLELAEDHLNSSFLL